MSDQKTGRSGSEAGAILKEARELLEATADLTDEKVIKARKRLEDALERGAEISESIRQQAVRGAQAVDHWVRENPYESVAVAFGAGAFLGLLLGRRN